MEKTLHIMNGDSSLHQIQKTNIEGDTFVWKELLCEGETKEDLTSGEFWTSRRQFLNGFFTNFTTEKHDRLKEQFFKLDLTTYEEVVLWFEYDLFCQINLMALLSWIHRLNIIDSIKVRLVCVGTHPNYKKRVGLGEISSQEFEEQYPKRQTLKPVDLKFADDTWKHYCSNDHVDLLDTIAEAERHNFMYLNLAIVAHLRRFPNTTNGLSATESKMLQAIAKEPTSKKQLVGKMLLMEDFYGFADLQYYKYLDDLSPVLMEKEGLLYLNDWGEKLINHKLDFNIMRKRKDKFGGAAINKFRWDEVGQKLVE